ncbi:hypothetical protein G5I_00404 [Acromyrmex echinatior]|uniref:Uncharacterized protein n=1 Tax=Acromyrmex echinatior TaxID=103372 RepID=F4W4S9_ACREC|nr:hypothetical protein G5I_00404 [Acromyrmex echinatior]
MLCIPILNPENRVNEELIRNSIRINNVNYIVTSKLQTYEWIDLEKEGNEKDGVWKDVKADALFRMHLKRKGWSESNVLSAWAQKDKNDNGRVQVNKVTRSAHQAIKYDWLDPQVRTNYAHSLGKHACGFAVLNLFNDRKIKAAACVTIILTFSRRHTPQANQRDSDHITYIHDGLVSLTGTRVKVTTSCRCCLMLPTQGYY